VPPFLINSVMKIHDIISEAPIQDFKTIGDFSKNSSFRDPRDRKILTHQRTIDIIKKKFENTEVDFNMYFVNSLAAGKHSELGTVSLEWVTENLGEEVASAINSDSDAISVIFTNNKGTQRLVMTPWIIAHRIAHTFFRYKNREYNMMREAYGGFVRMLSGVMSEYGINFPTSFDALMRDDRATKILMLFMNEVGNFNSARNKKLVNGFESLHEMFAQYLITGEVTFRPLPKVFGNRNMRFRLKADKDFEYDDIDHSLKMAGEYLAGDFSAVLHGSVNKIYVM